MRYSDNRSRVVEHLPTIAKPGRKLRLKERLGFLRDLSIVPFRGHGTCETLQIKGRLIESAGLEGKLATEGTALHNMLTTLRRMKSNEIPGARIRAEFADQSHDIYTDREGYFLLNLWLPERPLRPGWHDVSLTLMDSVGRADAHAVAQSFVPPPDADFLVVSDLDDTVIESSVFNRMTHIKLTLFKDAASRTPVDGAAPLYHRLVAGPSGRGNNPIFYLSRSGWNLNDLLEQFLDHHGLPKGPMFLRDLSFRESQSVALGSQNHKIDFIRHLLMTYSELPLVLIGDSGQRDQRIYWHIAMENPERIKAIYLHDMGRKRRDQEVKTITRDLESRGVPVVHSVDVTDYAEPMVEQGLIKPRFG